MVHSLAKGEVADLGVPTQGGISVLEVGTGWDKSTAQKGKFLGGFNKKRGVDLDLVAIAMDGPRPVRFAGFDQVDPLKNGNLIHSGDNQTGEGEGDDETVTARLDKIANSGQPVDGVVFIAGAFKKGSDFAKAANIEFNVYDSSDGRKDQVATYWPELGGGGNGIVIAKVNRQASGAWGLTVINEPVNIDQGNFNSILNLAKGY